MMANEIVTAAKSAISIPNVVKVIVTLVLINGVLELIGMPDLLNRPVAMLRSKFGGAVS